MSFGRVGKILCINLSDRRISVKPTQPYEDLFLGGSGINTKILYDTLRKNISPYSPDNNICFGAGILTGTPSPSSSRMTISALSTTGLLASSGIGGFIGAELKYAGYDNIIVDGKSEEPIFLYINNNFVEFRDATHLWGKNTYETQRLIKTELGHSVKVMCIGPAGEKLVGFSIILTEHGSAAGRCGLGAVMGSKNLKAIVLKGTQDIKVAKMPEFLAACEEAHHALGQNQNWGTKWPKKGQPPAVHEGIIDTNLKTGNFLLGNFEADVNWGENIERFKGIGRSFIKNQQIAWVQCAGCPNGHPLQCDVKDIGIGNFDCSGQLSFFGPVWNNDVRVAFEANYLCDTYGMDYNSTANIISFLMELSYRGIITEKDTDGILMHRGSPNAIIDTIHKLARQEGIGKLFKDGVLLAAREIGKGAEECAMHVKGLEMGPYEVRSSPATALAMAIAPAGSHVKNMNTITLDWPVLKEKKEQWALELYGTKEAAYTNTFEKKALLVWDQGNRNTAGDMLGVCHWISPWHASPSLRLYAQLYSLLTGKEITESELLAGAERQRTLERAFDVLRGIRREDDTLPLRLFDSPVPGGIFKGEKLVKERFELMLDEFYQLNNWDREGIPQKSAFIKSALFDEWEIFHRHLKKGLD